MPRNERSQLRPRPRKTACWKTIGLVGRSAMLATAGMVLQIETGIATAASTDLLEEKLGAIESEAAQVDIPRSDSDQPSSLRLRSRLLEPKLDRVVQDAAIG